MGPPAAVTPLAVHCGNHVSGHFTCYFVSLPFTLNPQPSTLNP
jgi:hypothetical protein